jgi:phospholipase D-like protein
VESLFVLVLLIGLVATAVWIYALVDAIRVPSDDDYRTGTKLIWVLVIIFGQLIGAIIYLAMGKPSSPSR